MKKAIILVIVFAAALVAASSARAQALPNQVQALYPQQTGEVAFADLRALRGSPHYARLKAQVLPERYRTLEQFGAMLGIDFEREVHQVSWGFVGAPDGGDVSFVGVAEGNFPAAEVEQKARVAKLSFSRIAGAPVVVMGTNAQNRVFVFAFPDRTTAIFGFRDSVEEMLTRRAQGGPSLLNNTALRAVVEEMNGKAPIWVALDNPYTVLAVKQMLPEATRLPGFANLTDRLVSSGLRFELKNGLTGQAAVRSQSAADAALLQSLLELGLKYQGTQLDSQSPELARAVKEVALNREGEKLTIGVAIRDADFAALLQKNNFTLNF